MHRLLLLPVILLILPGCVADPIDKALNELKKPAEDLSQITDVLTDLKKKLDNETYKNQVDTTIKNAVQAGQLGIQGSVDFTRARVREDLQSLKALIGGKEVNRIPVLGNSNVTTVSFEAAPRPTVVFIGWNLDVAQANPKEYKVTILNTGADGKKNDERPVEAANVIYSGPYALTLNFSGNGINLMPHDKKVLLKGYSQPFEIGITDSNPPPPERLTKIEGLLKTTNQDREGGIAKVAIVSAGQVIWSESFPEKPVWEDKHNESFSFPLDLEMPSDPKFFVYLSQEPPAVEKNILWRFDASCEIKTNRGNTLKYAQLGLSLRTDDDHKQANAPIQKID